MAFKGSDDSITAGGFGLAFQPCAFNRDDSMHPERTRNARTTPLSEPRIDRATPPAPYNEDNPTTYKQSTRRADLVDTPRDLALVEA